MASSGQNVIDFLNAHDIHWIPINIKLIDGKKIPIAPKGFSLKDITHFKNVDEDDMKILQKKHTLFDYIGIDTRTIHQLDIDDPNMPQDIKDYMNSVPYFESATKKLPHFFFKSDAAPTKNKILRNGNDKHEFLTGNWSFCRKDAVVHNSDADIPTWSLGEKKKKSKEAKETEWSAEFVEKFIRMNVPNHELTTVKEIKDNRVVITDSHYCERIGCCHKSNHSYFLIHNQKLITKCLDPECLEYTGAEYTLSEDALEGKSDKHAFDMIVKAFPERIKQWNHKIWAYDDTTGLWTDKALGIWKKLSHKVFGDTDYGSYKSRIERSFSFCDTLDDSSAFFENAERNTLGKLLYKDGVWDIENQRVHPFSHEFFFVIQIPRPVPKVRNEHHIAKVRKAIFEDPHPNEKVRNELKKSLIAALTGRNRSRRIWANIGKTGTGKSTLISMIQASYGGYFTLMDAKNFVISKNTEANAHCGFLVDMRYARIAMTSECEKNIKLDGNLLKTISGGDPIRARKAYENSTFFNIQSTLFFQANALAPIDPMDDAMRDRIKAINWKVQFKKNENRDESIIEYIKTDEATEAFFWILNDAWKLYESEGFCEVEEIEEYTKLFADEQDEFKQTFEEFFEVGCETDMIFTDHIYNQFKHFSKSQSHIKARLLEEYGVKCERKKCAGKWEGQKMCFVGIKRKEIPPEITFSDDY